MNTSYAVETEDLTRRFGDFTAVDRVTLQVASGEVFGSSDGGATWSLAARELAPVLSVRVA